MPIALPNAPQGLTNLPPAPQNPPTLVDISDAVIYGRQIGVSFDRGSATEANVGEAAVYQAAVIAEHAGGAVAPPWFGPALAAALAAQATGPAPAWFPAAFAAGIASLARSTWIDSNIISGDGRSRPFKIIPFVDGTKPTDPQHNLPALVDIRVINALTGSEINVYLQGYGIQLQAPFTIAEGRKAICIEIGCTAKF